MPADWADVRRIALALPGTEDRESRGHLGWWTGGRMFVWERPLRRSDHEALDALGRTAPQGPIAGVRVADEGVKAALLAESDVDAGGALFTIPHFDGYPAVLVLLERIGLGDLEELVTEAWLDRAPRRLAAAWLAEHPS
ncbi:MmcQ/YjbR family DNA-binding protein [Streptacidiphilus monticola]|uniref:MmcQ/YjbR family DNA-binding protein n=1 Tax=Streptacidiphilus monticola TaxID=2161674 RepID=A0ABW1G697_9ACTN